MRVKFRVGYYDAIDFDDLDILAQVVEEDLTKHRKILEKSRTDTLAKGEEWKGFTPYGSDFVFTAELEDALIACQSIEKACYIQTEVEDSAIVRKLRNRITSLENQITGKTGQNLPTTYPPESFNQKVNVHVPNIGLLLIDEVEVRYDLCTIELQGLLDEGWRIVAVCPQSDQRRPDYVMGRTKHGSL